ncbi:hypothetical protein [Deinococcus roseus]|uniref:DUF2335 domain-containing protein n=1 Tax=Deinococcus roseus TaxID=392414 RepID=A0ABQ2D3A4_9DEIO|nr:hypothetical protein [Deinococcus roseus]GGJ44241.1 hypothetical protein GCM10008938_33110 [Deinococcus roseus]
MNKSPKHSEDPLTQNQQPRFEKTLENLQENWDQLERNYQKQESKSSFRLAIKMSLIMAVVAGLIFGYLKVFHDVEFTLKTGLSLLIVVVAPLALANQFFGHKR